MQDAARQAVLVYSASLVLRIGGAVFVACPDDRLQSVYYRADAGVRSIWRHLRGSVVDPGLVRAAREAGRSLADQASALSVPPEFVLGFRDLSETALAQLEGDETASHDEMAARAVAAVRFLESGLASAEGAVDFERSCQAATESMMAGWTDDPLSTIRRIRRETGVWALAYQRFVRPEPGRHHG
jgi:hypothetical protein